MDILAETDRLTVYPILFPRIWDFYKLVKSTNWDTSQIDMSKDHHDFTKSLSEDEQTFIKHILAFFAASDTIVNINLTERFMNDVACLEAKFVYGFQYMMENVHSEVYSMLLDTIISNDDEKKMLFNSVKTHPTIKKKADWAFKYINDETATFAQRLVAFACVEGIFFSGAFCSIFWIKQRGIMPGLCLSNDYISRDEGLHTNFAVLLYDHLSSKLSTFEVYEIIKSAVDVEHEFIDSILPKNLQNMDAKNMKLYIQFVSDRLVQQLGYPKIFNSENPFPFMEMINVDGKTNFFERRVSEYQASNTKKRVFPSLEF
jgi:ribonucleotide reductase beta subunit family protein with ferritin-like domain